MLWPLTKAANKNLRPDYVLSGLARDNSFATWHYILPFRRGSATPRQAKVYDEPLIEK